ncbi:hypothetical protein AB0H83_22215 [Dactylosporangium sp. NPDC050688]|uniref:hypothetical protein n=1 Tax=Dactylosporangium sp. NPDC050688 TaxID=3157217 RepID=UPI00340A00AF
MSPKSRGRPAGRGKPKTRRQAPARSLRLSDRLVRAARELLTYTDRLEVEQWASGWLGQAWLDAPLGERDPEGMFILEVVGRCSTHPSPHGLAAVTALRMVAAPSEHALLDGTIDILRESQPAPPWPEAESKPVRAMRAVDVYDSERVLFIEYGTHTLLAQILTTGGVVVELLGLLQVGAAEAWSDMREADEVPMPIEEVPVADALADLADALRRTDMVWPRHDDEDFVDLRALAWARCRAYLPEWPDVVPMSDAERDELVEAFVGRTVDSEAYRTLADLFLDYGDGYLNNRPFGWSPGAVGMFLTDWLPRKALLDAEDRAALPDALRGWVRFALERRGVADEWITPVVDAVDMWLPEFEAAIDDESSWGPAKQIAAELVARGVDLSDKDAVDDVIRQLNAESLARRVIDPPQ